MLFQKPINWWFIGFLGVLIASLWFTHVSRVNHAVEITKHTVTTQLNKEYQTKLDKAVADAIASTKKMQEDADKQKAEKYAKLEANNAKLSSDLTRLQRRTQRPAPEIITKPSESGNSCTAAQLYREDAEFLTREAARADGIVIERDYYYDRYIAAKRILEELAKSK